MSSNLKVNSLVPATGTAIGIGTTGGTIDFRCPATFGGNVTIGGTLTYDEVINIDSIGIVTARSGLKVTGGQLDVGSNIKAGNAGVITATSFSGSGASLTALNGSNIASGTVAAARIDNLAASKITSGTVATARLGSGTANNSSFLRGDQTWAAPTSTTINNNATTKFITGTNNANELDCEANLSYNNSVVTFASSNLTINKSASPTISVTETAGSKSGQFRTNTDGVLVRSLGNYPLIFHTNQTEKARIDGSGNLAINKTSGISAKLHIGDDSNNGALSQLIKLANDSSNTGTGAQLNMGAASANESTAACIGGFYDGTGTSFIVKTAGTYANQSSVAERVRITNLGKVGINTDNPSQMLTVRGTILKTRTDSGLGLIYLQNDGSQNGQIAINQNGGVTRTLLHSAGESYFTGGNVGIGQTNPKTKLVVRGTIVSGRNLAREVGTISSYSTQYSGSRAASNVINGNKNYEYGYDWLTPGGSRVNANLVIDLGAQYNCDRFVIYNQNEYQDSKREVKNFTLEGSNDNSSWTTVLDDDCGSSGAHEPNPGFSFRIPASYYDDSEGASYRYWRFTMKTFHGTDNHGGVCELELYQTGTTSSGNQVGSEICTSSVVAGDMSAETLQGIKRLYSSKGMNIYTGGLTDTWEITEYGIVPSGSYQNKSTIRHKRGVMAVSSSYNTGDLYVRIDNLYNLPGNAWWVCGVFILSNEIRGTQAGGHHYVTSLQLMGIGTWNSVSTQNIVGSMSCSVAASGSNYVELFINVDDSSRGPCTVIATGPFDPPSISFA